jgi:hypothetical protein
MNFAKTDTLAPIMRICRPEAQAWGVLVRSHLAQVKTRHEIRQVRTGAGGQVVWTATAQSSAVWNLFCEGASQGKVGEYEFRTM